jgi:hypothetical protein
MKKIASLLIIILIASAFSAAAGVKLRKFYLTQSTFDGNEALTACADGYHMASLWEIFDVSNLRYDTTLGFTSADSGFGPPTNEGGWIRTGFDSDGTASPGRGNCLAWTSDIVTDAGSGVILSNDWFVEPTAINISPWFGFAGSCATENNVWCVQD